MKYYTIKLEVVFYRMEEVKMKTLDKEMKYADLLPREIILKIQDAEKNKYKTNQRAAEVHNKIPIILHNKRKYKPYRMYNLLGQTIINNFIIDLTRRFNDYLSTKYKIDNLELDKVNSFNDIEAYELKLEAIDENWLDWFYNTFLSEQEMIRTLMLIQSLDDFLKICKIANNIIEDIDKTSNITSDFYLYNLCQSFSKFRDKMKKIGIIKKENFYLQEINGLDIKNCIVHNNGNTLIITTNDSCKANNIKFKKESLYTFELDSINEDSDGFCFKLKGGINND